MLLPQLPARRAPGGPAAPLTSDDDTAMSHVRPQVNRPLRALAAEHQEAPGPPAREARESARPRQSPLIVGEA